VSPRAAVAPATGGGRIAITVLLVLLVAVGLLLVVRARPQPGALDPRSNRPDGTRALVLLLEKRGATVDITRRAPDTGAATRVLVLDDSLDRDVRDELLAFVDAGGVAVVADAESSLHGGTADAGAIEFEADDAFPEPIAASASAEANVGPDPCTIDALAHLRGVFVRDAVLVPVAGTAGHCLANDADHALVVRRDVGRGVIVGLGDNGLLTNDLIRYADNSGLAVALLAPDDGARVTILLGDSVSKAPDEIGTGEDTLGDLIRPGVWLGIAQLGIAFVVLALAKGIRAGRVVDEPLPSPLAGSSAVTARATMMQRARHHEQAAWLLRSELFRELCTRYHLSRDATVDAVDRAAVDHDGFAPGEVGALLVAQPQDRAGLADLAARIAATRARLTATFEPAGATR
jgi:hypothetical protein